MYGEAVLVGEQDVCAAGRPEEDVAGDVCRLYFFPKDYEQKAHILGAVLSVNQVAEVFYLS